MMRVSQTEQIGKAGSDIVTFGVAVAAILLFIGTGSRVMPQAIRSLIAVGPEPDQYLVSALLLNIALVIFGWRRYRELSAEIADRCRAEALACKLAFTDALTGCLNRRAIHDAVESLAANAQDHGQRLACFLIDLDNFKQVNDFNGHRAGDEILIESVRRITAILPSDAVLARIGGDEFACFMRFDPLQSEMINRKASAIIQAISRPLQTGDFPIGVTVSLGVSRCDDAADDNGKASKAEVLMQLADIAMYHAKKQGRNRYAWFEAAMECDRRFGAELKAGIRRGISQGEFVPFYEQQVDLASGQLTGFEVLARWNSPTMGMVNPEVFIPVAEEIGVIAELSESVILQALVDSRDWDPSIKLSINISPLQLRDPWFAQKLLKMLIEANFPPTRLDVEVTESCLHENVSEVRTMISSLKNQGISISLDDFGTGYSSLSQLRTLPFDRIKIDRSFIIALPESKDSATIVQAIISLGDGLGMPITAEGIETQEILDLVRTFGMVKGQGYFYGRPQSAADTRKLLAARSLSPELVLEPEAVAAPTADQRLSA